MFTLVCYFLRNKWLEFDDFSFQWMVLLSRLSKAKKIVISTMGYLRMVISLKFRVHVYPSMLFYQEPVKRVLSFDNKWVGLFCRGVRNLQHKFLFYLIIILYSIILNSACFHRHKCTNLSTACPLLNFKKQNSGSLQHPDGK